MFKNSLLCIEEPQPTGWDRERESGIGPIGQAGTLWTQWLPSLSKMLPKSNCPLLSIHRSTNLAHPVTQDTRHLHCIKVHRLSQGGDAGTSSWCFHDGYLFLLDHRAPGSSLPGSYSGREEIANIPPRGSELEPGFAMMKGRWE